MIRTEWSEHHTHLAVHSSSVTLPPTKGYDDHGQVSSVSLCHGRFQRFFQILDPPIYSFVDLGTMNLLKSHTLSQKLLLFQEIRLVFISFAGNQVVFHSFSPCKTPQRRHQIPTFASLGAPCPTRVVANHLRRP